MAFPKFLAEKGRQKERNFAQTSNLTQSWTRTYTLPSPSILSSLTRAFGFGKRARLLSLTRVPWADLSSLLCHDTRISSRRPRLERADKKWRSTKSSVLRDPLLIQRGERLKRVLSLSLSLLSTSPSPVKIRPPIDRIDYRKPYPWSH